MLATLVPSIRRTTELVLDISAASHEQSIGTEQINRAIQELDGVTQQNSTIAEQTASAAEELVNQAQQLQHAIAFFTISSESFQTPESSHNGATGLKKIPKGAGEKGMPAESPTPVKSKSIVSSDEQDSEFNGISADEHWQKPGFSKNPVFLSL